MVYIDSFRSAHYSQTILMDGEQYNLETAWNTRGSFWSLSISDSFDTPIVLGIKLVLDLPLFSNYRYTSLPKGDLVVFDFDTNNKSQITFEDFTNDRKLRLIYVSEGEIV